MNRDIDVEASQWLARLSRGDVSDDVRADFERWCGADERCMVAYARLAATWQRLDRVKMLRPPTADVDANFFHPTHRVLRGFPSWRFGRRWAIAATVLVMLGMVTGYVLLRDPTYATDTGGFQRLVLKDASVIELNTDTRVRISYTHEMRTVHLVRGEAHFRVAHEASRPFVVLAGKAAIRAVGTEFNVRERGDSVEVTVTEGKVAVGSAAMASSHDTSSALQTAPVLAAGEEAVTGAGGLQMRKISSEAAARRLAWQEGMLAFERESLITVAAEFNRYNTRQLTVHPDVAQLKIGGYFRATNLDAFISILAQNFSVHANQTAGRIELSAAKPPQAAPTD